MKMGSLFAGIGGFDLGFRNAGFDIAWQVEIDRFCQAVLAKNFPEVKNRYGDIREVGAHGGDRPSPLEPVDVICGGFPCQDISAAKKGAEGIKGARSGLWWEMWRITRDLRPRYMVAENVSMLTRRGLDIVLGSLAAIGYDAEWQNIPCYAVGGPHRRERIWIVAYPNGFGPRTPFFEAQCFSKAIVDPWENYIPDRSIEAYGHRFSSLPQDLLLDDGLSPSLDWIKGFGNAVAPIIPEMIAHRINQLEQQQRRAA